MFSRSLFFRVSALVLGIMIVTVWATLSAINYSVRQQFSDFSQEIVKVQQSSHDAASDLLRQLSESTTVSGRSTADRLTILKNLAADFAAKGPEGPGYLLLDEALQPFFATEPIYEHANAEFVEGGMISISASSSGDQPKSLDLVTDHFREIRSAQDVVIAYVVSLPPMTPRPDDQQFARRAWTDAAFWLLVILVVGMALSTLVIQWAVRPVDQLTAAAAKLNRGVFPDPLTAPNIKELHALFSAFNRAVATMRRTGELRKQMIADVAHELRTPLTNLRAQVDAFDADLITDRAMLARTLRQELGLLSRLVEDFQQLSLSDAGQLEIHMQELDVASVASSWFQSQSESLEFHVDDRLDREIWIRGDPDRIQQVLLIILSNAMRHREEGLTVRLDLLEVGEQVGVRISDNGPGIDENANEKIFERFYRGEVSRQQDAAGAGLGLTIARSLMTAMGGAIHAAPACAGGESGAQFDLLFAPGTAQDSRVK